MTPELAQWLGANGFADPHSPGRHGNTPLLHAAWKADESIVEALLAEGASLTATNDDGNNALWLACVSEQPALLRRLVQAGVAIDHANLLDATALMYCASTGRATGVATLLTLGADPGVRSQDGFSALDMASTLEVLRLLRPVTPAAPSIARATPAA